MRILFIEAFFKTTEPMSVMLLSSLAKQRGHQTFLFNFDQGRADLKKYLTEIKPDVVAYSAMTGDHRYLLAANKIVKDHDRHIFTVMGGRHGTFFPEVLKNSDLDALCLGEGEDAWVELLAALEQKKDISTIPNIVTRQNFNNFSLRPRRSELDSLPFLDYELCYQNIPFLGKSLKRTLMTSRGCPYACTYCFNHAYNKMYQGQGPVFVRQSVDRVIAEAKYIMERWPTKFIKFYDDDFALAADDWLREFAAKWPKEIGLPFHCLIRADVVAREPEILTLLKKAGVCSVSMSLESGNDYIRNNIFKRNMSRQQLQQAFDLAWDLGIPTFSNAILAVPIPKEEEQKLNLPKDLERNIESVDLSLKLKTAITEYMPLFPYPKTEIGDYCRQQGFFSGDYDVFTISYQNRSPLDCFSAKEKMVQQNLGLLGTALQVLAGSRQAFIRSLTPLARFLVVKILIKLPLGKLYLLPYVMALNYVHRAKLYAFKPFDLWEWLRAIGPSYRFNLKRQFEKSSEN